ncbi:aspartic peptidase domain-containing protein [Neohortaea acidophila]|uniref:Aspartic peptidase domain-containing protein n=1 Tax=Neohortaea acidophila TaxID=245834 RepID=A0A6A6PQW5_9PEZI|nr:aspartic peptidase domain-containing protein [Neohortaea acidophila]KAF2482402.1 aspartic peptidase domain-containing protein [Neohortaea acidophila]
MNAKSRSAIVAQAIREQARAAAGRLENGSATLLQEESGTIFLVPVTVGGQQFDVVLDTGSSDPWLITPNFTCVDIYTNTPINESYCYFGPPYSQEKSSTYHPLPNENMNVSYSDGEFLTGSMGYETFTMGGITVPKQEFGLINYAGWLGDGVSSGLIGFAYSTITSAYNGTNATADVRGDTIKYNPLFTNMWESNTTAPIFALALDRTPPSGGLLSLGGLPSIPHSPIYITTPIQSVGVYANSHIPVYEYYTIVADGFALSNDSGVIFGPVNTTSPRKTPLYEAGDVIVDSGTSLLYAPNNVANAFAAAFDPPATLDDSTGLLNVACTGTPPIFGVSVGGKVFYVNPVDLIIEEDVDQCISGVQPSNGGLTILGDVWMKNVVVVHDIAAEVMGFMAREFLNLTASPVVAPGY